jgi:hypothetical protein
VQLIKSAAEKPAIRGLTHGRTPRRLPPAVLNATGTAHRFTGRRPRLPRKGGHKSMLHHSKIDRRMAEMGHLRRIAMASAARHVRFASNRYLIVPTAKR